MTTCCKQENINAVDRGGNTALHWACWNNYDSANLEVMLMNGADPNIQNIDGITPFRIVCNNPTLNVIKLFLLHGANPNISDHLNNMTPFSRLFWEFNDITPSFELILIMLKHNADPNTLVEDDDTLFHRIVDSHFNITYDIIKMFLEYGANPNIKNSEGDTPFSILCHLTKLNDYHKSKYCGIYSTDTVQLMMSFGAKIEI
jgi:ankyrin repeat protein